MATGKKMLKMSPGPTENENLLKQYIINGADIFIPKPFFQNRAQIIAPFIWQSANLKEIQCAKISIDALSEIVEQFAASTNPITESRDPKTGAVVYELFGFQKAKAIPAVNSLTGTYVLNPYTLRDISRIALAYRPDLFNNMDEGNDF